MSKSEEFYEKLYSQLKSTNTWPNFYLFKFIIKSNTNNLELIKINGTEYLERIKKNNRQIRVDLCLNA